MELVSVIKIKLYVDLKFNFNATTEQLFDEDSGYLTYVLGKESAIFSEILIFYVSWKCFIGKCYIYF